MTVYQWTAYDIYKSQHTNVREYYDTVHRCFRLSLDSLLPQPCDWRWTSRAVTVNRPNCCLTMQIQSLYR